MTLGKRNIVPSIMRLAVYIFVATATTSAMAQTNDRRDQQLLLAWNLTECSGAYYASSEVTAALKDHVGNTAELHEKGNGFLLTAARLLTSAEIKSGFDAAYKRAEASAQKIKTSWIQRISETGDAGVAEINHTTEACEKILGARRDAVLGHMRQEMQAPTGLQ